MDRRLKDYDASHGRVGVCMHAWELGTGSQWFNPVHGK